jgi:hypothetical protein
MKVMKPLRQAQQASARALRLFASDVGNGLLEVSHNSLALLGLGTVAVLIVVAGRADLRHQAETVALDWLQTRQEQRDTASGSVPTEADAVARATAANPRDLPHQQAAVAGWLARRYKVAPEPISALVQEAWGLGRRSGLDPTLILAIMAIESSFNPFAQSTVGAQGLMQVVTRIHDDKYEAFGGNHAAFDPISNLRVGVQVLKECIARAGNLQDGLRYYVGAALHETDGGYATRVLAEQGYLRAVADGKRVPFSAAHPAPAAKSAQPRALTEPAPAEAGSPG